MVIRHYVDYLAHELPHKTNPNKSLLVFWDYFRNEYVIVLRNGDEFRPVAVCKIYRQNSFAYRKGREYMKCIYRANQFRYIFPKFNPERYGTRISDFVKKQVQGYKYYERFKYR